MDESNELSATTTAASAEAEQSLDKKRFDLEKFRIEQEVRIQNERLAIDRGDAKRAQQFLRNPALVSAAISLAAVLVSGAQVWVAKISKDKDVALADKQNQREISQRIEAQQGQFDLDRAKLIIEHKNDLFGGDPVTSQRMSMLIQTLFPPNIAAQIIGDSPGKSLNASINMGLVIEKVSGDNQVIPLRHWGNFAVRVLDGTNRPVVGAKVAWQMSVLGTFTYVGATDDEGISTATNIYTSFAPATRTQLAEVVDRDTPVGFTDAAKVKRIAGPVIFNFDQR